MKRLEAYTIGIIKWGDEKFDRETGEIIQPELKPEDVKDKILEIISNLTKAKDVIDVQYNQDFIQIYESKQEKSATQLAKNLTRMAQETNNPQFVKQAKAVERRVAELKQSVGELEKENANKEEENKRNQEKIQQLNTENLFLLSDVPNDTKEFKSLQHHITHTSTSIAEYIATATESLINGDTEKALEYMRYAELENQMILTLSNFVSKAKFDTKVNKITDDIITFIDEYISNLYLLTHKKIKINIEKPSYQHIYKFVPIEVIILVDNILNNAPKHHAKNIEISWLKNEDHIELHISNDGDTLSDEILPHVFEYRFSTTGGGGIGLYYAKEIITRMNGFISVNNKRAKGVEFIISFKK